MLILLLVLQLLHDIRKAIEAMNPVYSVREDGANLEISFPKCVVGCWGCE